MKNHLAGFFISASLHLGVVGLVINLDTSEASKTPGPDQIPLSLAMFKSEPVKVVPVAEITPKEIKPEPIVEPIIEPVVEPIVTEKVPIEPEPAPVIEPIVEPIVVEKAPVEPEPEPIVAEQKPIEPEPVVKPLPIIKKQTKEVIKPVKPEKKRIVKPKPVKKKKTIVKKKVVKKKKPKVVRKPVVKKVKRKVVKRKRVAPPVRKIVQKAPVRKAKPVLPTARPAAPKRVVKARPKPTRQATRPAVNGVQVARTESTYKTRLRKLIGANKRYPKRAKRRRQQGTVRVSFVIYPNGMIKNIRTVNSSGHATLDKAAISAIQKISGKLPFPGDLKRKQWVLTIPVSYKLR